MCHAHFASFFFSSCTTFRPDLNFSHIHYGTYVKSFSRDGRKMSAQQHNTNGCRQTMRTKSHITPKKKKRREQKQQERKKINIQCAWTGKTYILLLDNPISGTKWRKKAVNVNKKLLPKRETETECANGWKFEQTTNFQQ